MAAATKTTFKEWFHRNWWKILREAFLFFNIFLMLFPLYFMVLSATKTGLETSINPLSFPEKFPQTFFSNVESVLTGNKIYRAPDGSTEKIAAYTPFLLMLKNSFLLTMMSLAVMMAVAVMFGYALGTKKFKGKMAFIYFLLIIQTVPFFGYIKPLWIVADMLRITDSLVGAVPVYVAASLPMAVILFQGFFQSFPTEIEEAARIDGCSEVKMFLKIVMPLSVGAIMSLTIINFMGFWNEYALANLLFGQTVELVTINIGIMKTNASQGGMDLLNYQFTLLTLSALPNFIFFTVFQKRIMKGVTLGAIKG